MIASSFKIVNLSSYVVSRNKKRKKEKLLDNITQYTHRYIKNFFVQCKLIHFKSDWYVIELKRKHQKITSFKCDWLNVNVVNNVRTTFVERAWWKIYEWVFIARRNNRHLIFVFSMKIKKSIDHYFVDLKFIIDARTTTW
jgi:hypothetical protein